MSKRTISLIVALFLVTALLLAIALSHTPLSTPQSMTNSVPNSPMPTPVAQTVLNFSPSIVSVPAGVASPQTVNVVIASGSNQVTGVDLELSYDPNVLTNMSIKLGDMFQNPFIWPTNKVDTKNGRISYAFAIAPSQKPQQGSGTVAVLSFVPNPFALDANGQKVTQTTIKIMPKSVVTAHLVGDSVLMPSSLSNTATITFNTSGTSSTQSTTPQPSSSSGY